jgi:hypothetical protein
MYILEKKKFITTIGGKQNIVDASNLHHTAMGKYIYKRLVTQTGARTI